MKYEIVIDKPKKLFIIYTNGEIELEVEKNMIYDVVSHPMWNSQYNLLFDHTNSSLANFQTIDIQELSKLLKSQSEQLGMIKLAIVLSTDLNYGLGRMWEAYTRYDVKCDIEIFRTYAEAELWLIPH